ncbi:hypothetical protein BCR44DRAFT_1499117 [Catenaria anguillulae PL171]|uniref:HotDog domain-containing protein n=1 Tax=Catenaria anguillulae PL171 TaxID=765915 RepID=A0A1Y2HNT8_9FUNG|nr:hypothetical protein BCR44DRAFT_1499117 [Catenaria anguillulae PL171]
MSALSLPSFNAAASAVFAHPLARPAIATTALLAGALGLYLRRVLRDPSPLVTWKSLSALPSWLRRWWFTKLVHLANPFSNTGRVHILSYDFGRASVGVREHRSLRNPYRSIHAAELALLGETAGGLAFLGTLDEKTQRAIPTELNCKYFKKARGYVVAVAQVDTPARDVKGLDAGAEVRVPVVAQIRQGGERGEVLAEVTTVFVLSRKTSKKA